MSDVRWPKPAPASRCGRNCADRLMAHIVDGCLSGKWRAIKARSSAKTASTTSLSALLFGWWAVGIAPTEKEPPASEETRSFDRACEDVGQPRAVSALSAVNASRYGSGGGSGRGSGKTQVSERRSRQYASAAAHDASTSLQAPCLRHVSWKANVRSPVSYTHLTLPTIE